MAVRRRLYQMKWYKALEETFTKALSVRFDLIAAGEEVPSAGAFVEIILSDKLRRKNTTPMREIVEAIDRRARGEEDRRHGA